MLDLSHAVAGPFCTYQLALMGAEVIKVERPVSGDDLRQYTEHGGFPGMSAPFIANNGGKRSITLDLKQKQGGEIAERLLRRSDVVVENFRPGVAKRLNVDWVRARKCNPRLVYCSITGFGQTGALRDWTAYDNVIQAMSGLMMENATSEGYPLKVDFPVADICAGFTGAYAILAALLQRERLGTGGQGQYVDVSMLDATLVLMTPNVVTSMMGGATTRHDRNAGYRRVVTSGTYETRDGYIAIAANHQSQIERLCDVLGVPALPKDERFNDHEARLKNGEALREILAELFRQRSAAEVEQALAARQVPAAKVRTLREVVSLPHLAERGVLGDIGLGGRLETGRAVRTGFQFAVDGPRGAGEVPALGQHTTEILRELGYCDADIAAMRVTGTIDAPVSASGADGSSPLQTRDGGARMASANRVGGEGRASS